MSIVDFLMSQKQQALLGKLLLNPDKSFTHNELIALVGPGRGAGQRELKRLLDSGVVKDTRVGNQRLISANSEFVLFHELKMICIKSFGIVDVLEKALQPLSNEIKEAFIFGSIAKNTATSHSDVDLMVIGDVSGLALNEALAEAEQTLGRPIHISHYQTDEWQLASQDNLVQSILNGPKLKVIDHVQTYRGNQ